MEISVEKKNSATKCTKCLRTKDEALEQQLQLNKPCEITGCPFCDEIKNAIEEKNRIPPFKINKRNEPEKRTMKITKVTDRND